MRLVQVSFQRALVPVRGKRGIHPFATGTLRRIRAVLLQPAAKQVDVERHGKLLSLDAQFSDGNWPGTVDGLNDRGGHALGRILFRANPLICIAGIDVTAMTLQERRRHAQFLLHQFCGQARPVGPRLLILIADGMCREVIPEQRRFALGTIKVQNMDSGIEPALVIGRVWRELFVSLPGLGVPGFFLAVVAGSDRPALAHGQRGGCKIVLGQCDGADDLLFDSRHIFRRQGTPLAQVAEAGHGMRVCGAQPDVASRNPQLLFDLVLNTHRHVRRHGADVQRHDGGLQVAAPQHECVGCRGPADSSNAALLPRRAMKPAQFDAQRRRGIGNALPSLQCGLAAR